MATKSDIQFILQVGHDLGIEFDETQAVKIFTQIVIEEGYDPQSEEFYDRLKEYFIN